MPMQIENERNNIAARDRWYNLLNWTVHVEKVEKHFKSVCEKANKTLSSEHSYVMRSDSYRQIQLFAGQHPIGSSQVICDAFNRETNHRLQFQDISS